MKKRIQLLVSAAMMLLVLTATTGCKEVMSSLDNPVSAYLQVKADSIVAFYGEPVSLKASTISTEPITYTSSDETIASVDQNGYVTAHKCGDVIITMTVAANEYYLGATKQVKVSARSKEMLVPLTIEAIETGTITIDNPNNLTIKYSLNGADKVSFSGWQSIPVSAGDKVEFFGNNEGYCDVDNTWNRTRFYTSNKAYLYGNIMSLVSENNYQNRTTLTKDYAFSELFTGQWVYTGEEWIQVSYFLNHPTKEIVLPATKLTVGCYQDMFYGCSSLTKAPDLPAKEVPNYCYGYMFYNCTKLVEAPEIAATKVGDYCCQRMFYSCSSLTKAPELPATELAEGCYQYMFYNCAKLTEAPALPATELADICYQGMFYNCDALTKAPELPATKLASNCYYAMFYGCDKLTSAPELPATELAYGCYQYMFYNCAGLTTPPSELPATKLAPYCYYMMFQYCSVLTATPKILATTLDEQSCLQMFTFSPKIKEAYVKFGYTNPNSAYMFYAYGDGVEDAVLHTTADSKASWESYFKSMGLSNWTVKADY